MRLVAASTLIAFSTANPASAAALNSFRRMVRAADWLSMDDVRAAASTVKVLNGERARFEIAGGRFRMIVAINFAAGIVFVKFVGTHAEYDKVNAGTYTLEFKQDAARLVESGQGMAAAARSLGVVEQTLGSATRLAAVCQTQPSPLRPLPACLLQARVAAA